MKKFSILLLVLICVGCNSPKTEDTSKEIMEVNFEEEKTSIREFDLQGHRGARGLFPENSLEGFAFAVDLMVNTMEMDVVVSRDLQVVVSHEPWISSTICWGLNDKPVAEGKSLNIYLMDYAEVTNYNCGSQPHPDFPLQAKFSTFKPLLSEVVTEVEANVASLELEPTRYNIEIKSTPDGDNIYHPEPNKFCQLVLDQVNELNIKDRTIIQSFDVRALQQMKHLDRSIPVALLIAETNGFEKDLENLGFTPEVYSPNFRLVDEQLVKNCHQNGIQLIPWTVNEEEDMQRLLELGVDGIITDYPDIALTLKM
jgi:glycerophosphoryl diester phosphodiesterase